MTIVTTLLIGFGIFFYGPLEEKLKPILGLDFVLFLYRAINSIF